VKCYNYIGVVLKLKGIIFVIECSIIEKKFYKIQNVASLDEKYELSTSSNMI